MKLPGTYFNWDFNDCWAINNKYNGGYPYLKGTDEKIIKVDPTFITVFDGENVAKTIKYPQITFLDNDGNAISQYQGDEEGVISMENIVINGNYSVEVSAENYGSYLNKKYEIKAFSTQTIILYPQTDKPVIHCANFKLKEKDESYIDVLQSSVTLSQKENKKFDLDISGTYANGIKEICLVQGGKIKKKNETGFFKELTAQDFDNGTPIYVQIIGNDGVIGDMKRMYLSISDVSAEKVSFGGGVKLDKIEIQVDSKVPFVGGGTITLNDLLKDNNIFESKIEDGKFKATINLRADSDDQSLQENDAGKVEKDKEPTYDELVKLLEYNKKEGMKEYLDKLDKFTKKYDSILKSKDFTQFDLMKSKAKIEAKVFGYMEIDMNTGAICKVKLAVYIGGKADCEVGFNAAGLPCVLICEFSANAEGSINAEGTIELLRGDEDDVRWTLDTDAKIKISAGVGPGIPKLASFTYNGSGELEVQTKYNTYNDNSNINVNLTTDVFWKLKILSFEMQNSLIERKYNLYDYNSKQENVQNNIKGNQMLLSEKDFSVGAISGEGKWQVENIQTQTIDNDSDIEILSEAYNDSSPQIIQSGNVKMLVFLHQNTDRMPINATEVMYSLYDTDAQAWGNPKAVYDDGTADFYPQVVQNNGEIYIIWENISSAVTDETELNKFASMGNIMVAKYDEKNDTFSICSFSDKHMVFNPYMDSQADKIIWTVNENQNVLDSSKYAVMIADYDGSNITSPKIIVSDIKNLIMAKVGLSEGKVVIAYIYDKDGNYETANDRILNVIDLQGNVLYESEPDTISDVEFIKRNGVDRISFAKAGNIIILNNYSSEVILSGNMQINGNYLYIGGENEYFVFQAENTNDGSSTELYAYIYNKKRETWDDAVKITDTGSMVTAYDAILNGNGLQIIYQQSNITEETEKASLHIKDVEKAVDLSINNTVCDEEYMKLNLSANIINVGLKAASGYTVSIYDGKNEIYTENIMDTIEAGGVKTYELVLETDKIIGDQKNIEVVVRPFDEKDADDSNNKTYVTVGYPDIAVSLGDEKVGNDVYIADVELHNKGNSSTCGKLNVFVCDKQIMSVPVDELSAGEYKTIQVNMNVNELDFVGEVGIVKLEYVADKVEMYLYDNIAMSDVYKKADATLESINVDDVTVKKGESADLKIKYITTNNVDQNRLAVFPVEYSIDNSEIANITESGVVIGVKQGTTTLHVVAKDIFGNIAEDTCIIHVKENSAQESGGSVENNTEDNAENNTENQGGGESQNSGESKDEKDNTGEKSTEEKTKKYHIRYKLNGGKNNKKNPAYYGKKDIRLRSPSRKGYIFKGWYTDKKYKTKIIVIRKESKKDYTLYAKWTKVNVAKVSITSAKNSKGKKIVLKSKKVSGAKGYEISYSTDKKFKKAVTKKNTTKTSYTISKLKKGKTYYVRIRAYKVDSTGKKVYGKYSSVKKVKISK